MLNSKFGSSKTPFEIITRLTEETGELAEQVNIFEDMGIKREKHGQPDKAKLAKEVQDVIRCAMQIAIYYDIENDVTASIDKSLDFLEKNISKKTNPFIQV